MSRIAGLNEKLLELESASKKKLTGKNLVHYVKVKNSLFSLSFLLYLKSVEIPTTVIEGLSSEITKAVFALLHRLKQIKTNQVKYYPNFDDIVADIERIGEYNSDILGNAIDHTEAGQTEIEEYSYYRNQAEMDLKKKLGLI